MEGSSHIPSRYEAQNEIRATVASAGDLNNDGIVDPFDHFNTASRLRDFRIKLAESMKWNNADHMKKYKILSLPGEEPFTEAELLDIMQGYSPKEIADMVFYDNSRKFLSKYYTNAYLKGVIV